MQRVRDGNWVRVLAGLDQWSVTHGDCFDVMRAMPDECVHAVVTRYSLRGEGLEQEVLF
jgi:hypothetical protein